MPPEAPAAAAAVKVGTGPAPGGLDLQAVLPEGVGVFMSTRQAVPLGLSGVNAIDAQGEGPFAGWNLGDHVGDESQRVRAHRLAYAQVTGTRPLWLRQVHGVGVVDAEAHLDGPPPQADASVAVEPGVACTVQVADCLPVLLSAPGGRGVAAAHAGWRGLAAGVVEAALARLCERTGCTPSEVWAWLGPCIGPRRFEVGAEVVQAFGAPEHFKPAPRPDGGARWLADLAALARARLAARGLRRIDGGHWCTVEDARRFYSFRRDGVTGRLAASIWVSR